MVLAAPFCSPFPFPKLPGQPLSQTRAREGGGWGGGVFQPRPTTARFKTPRPYAQIKKINRNIKNQGAAKMGHTFIPTNLYAGAWVRRPTLKARTRPPPQHFLSQIFEKPRILNPLSFKAQKIFCFRKKLGDKCWHKVGMQAGWKGD